MRLLYYPLLFLSAFLLSNLDIQAQTTKVGVGTSNPQEELDVQGDINVTGAIKTNMQTGTEGQILQMQSGGSMGWVDLCEYKNYQVFISPTQTWTAPVGVTSIAMELWGGGGAGNIAGGGGAGGYAFARIAVVPGNVYTIDVGTSGSSTTPGGNSEFRYGVYYIRARGGQSAGTSGTGEGGSYGFTNNTNVWKVIGRSGEDGEASVLYYSQKSSTIYVETIEYGDGGDSPLRPYTGGNGGMTTKDLSTTNYIRTSWYGYGDCPGGGGGGYYYSTGGGTGMVIIYW